MTILKVEITRRCHFHHKGKNFDAEQLIDGNLEGLTNIFPNADDCGDEWTVTYSEAEIIRRCTIFFDENEIKNISLLKWIDRQITENMQPMTDIIPTAEYCKDEWEVVYQNSSGNYCAVKAYS